MSRLGFSLVWFGLICFISLFEENDRETIGGEKTVGEKTYLVKDLEGKRPSGEKS